MEHECIQYMHTTGTDAQGNEVRDNTCAFVLNSMLTVETNKRIVGMQAAIEGLRNEVFGENQRRKIT